MRVGKPLDLEDISQVLVKGTCPICAFLRNDQAGLLRGELPPEEVNALCNFHGWALAAGVDRETVGHVYLNVLRQIGSINRYDNAEQCSFCQHLLRKQVIHLNQLIEQMKDRRMLLWIRKEGTFCYMHANHLRQMAPAALHPVIDEVLQRSATALRGDLEDLLRHIESGKTTGGGVLGRAAEFLVSQRGLSH